MSSDIFFASLKAYFRIYLCPTEKKYLFKENKQLKNLKFYYFNFVILNSAKLQSTSKLFLHLAFSNTYFKLLISLQFEEPS